MTEQYDDYGPMGDNCTFGVLGKKTCYPQQVAAMLINNDTGAVIAFMPHRNTDNTKDYHTLYNFAIDEYLQIGSTMKPIGVYAPAMALGIAQPGSTILDLPYDYPGTNDPVTNFVTQAYHGFVSVRKALYNSYNIPAVKTYVKMMHHGVDVRKKFMPKMDVNNLVGANHPNFGIGSVSRGMTLLKTTSAYSTFGNNGKHHNAFVIKKITNDQGKVIYQHEQQSTRVFSEQTNYLMVDMMRDVIDRGTAAALPGLLNFQTDWAGKTGTASHVTDEMFIATNPNVTLGIWTGYRFGTHMPYGPAAHRTQELWALYANAIHKVAPNLIDPDKSFDSPSGIVHRTVCTLTGKLPTDLCSSLGLTRTDIFNAKYAPTEVGNALVGKSGYVVIDGEKYLAHKNTPAAFTEKGAVLNEDYFTDSDHFLQVTMNKIHEYVDFSKDIVPAEEIEENGKRPAKVSGLTLHGNQLTWHEVPEKDIIGYRVYAAAKGAQEFHQVAIIKNDNHLSYTINTSQPMVYVVTAVDIAGNESKASKYIKNKTWHKAQQKEEKQKKHNNKKQQNNKQEQNNKQKQTNKQHDQNSQQNETNKPNNSQNKSADNGGHSEQQQNNNNNDNDTKGKQNKNNSHHKKQDK